jgi:hypothetical protein
VGIFLVLIDGSGESNVAKGVKKVWGGFIIAMQVRTESYRKNASAFLSNWRENKSILKLPAYGSCDT